MKPSPINTGIHPDTPSTWDEGQCVLWLITHDQPVPHTKPGLKPRHYIRLLRSFCSRRIVDHKTDRLMRLLPESADRDRVMDSVACSVYAVVCPVCQCRTPVDRECECGTTYANLAAQYREEAP
jgi:hypothetical protein